MRYRYISYKYSRKVGPDPLFQNVWDSFHSWAMPSTSVWRPPTDVYETSDTLVILVELAGIPEDHLEITLFNDLLVVEGEREIPPFPDAAMSSCHQLGIKYGRFRSEVPIPFAVDQDTVHAEYRNGLLRISLEKAE